MGIREVMSTTTIPRSVFKDFYAAWYSKETVPYGTSYHLKGDKYTSIMVQLHDGLPSNEVFELTHDIVAEAAFSELKELNLDDILDLRVESLMPYHKQLAWIGTAQNYEYINEELEEWPKEDYLGRPLPNPTFFVLLDRGMQRHIDELKRRLFEALIPLNQNPLF